MGKWGSSESALLQQCRATLNYLQSSGLLIYRRINISGVQRTIGNRVVFTKNEMVGMADLMVFVKNGPVLNIECKSAKGVLSDHQKAWQKQLTEMGHKYFVLKDIKGLIPILKENGVTHWSLG